MSDDIRGDIRVHLVEFLDLHLRQAACFDHGVENATGVDPARVIDGLLMLPSFSL